MQLLKESAIILTAAVAALPLFKRLGLGTVLGYLAAGVVIGPDVTGLVTDVDKLRQLSELGVVFLLFIIGLELQPSRLWALRKPVFGLGGAQVVITTVVLAAAGKLLGLNWAAALIAGFGLSMSSTAFALQTLAEKKQLTTQFGRTAFAILLFQDVSVIPVLALLPLASGIGDDTNLPMDIARSVAAVFAIVIGGRLLLRPFFRIMAKADSHELFTAAALLVVVGTAFFMDKAELSMTLGSFLAGVLLADSEYRHELEATMEPFKGLLLGLFFTAVGMSVDLSLIINKPGLVIGLAAALIATKAALLFVLGRFHGLNNGNAINLAVAISQGGEFAFVLYAMAVEHSVMPKETSHLLIAVVTVSMALSPIIYKFVEWVQQRQAKAASDANYDTIDTQESQVILAGFGRIGQVVARVLRLKKIPFTALDGNYEQVDFVRRFGGKVYFGDASRLDLLRTAGLEHAKIFVLAVDDVESSVKIAELVKRYYPHLKIYARARNRQHVYRLRDIGVDVVIREAFYSSLEMSRQLLTEFGATDEEAMTLMERFRIHDEKVLLKQQQFHHDEKKLIAATKQALIELEDLFEQDVVIAGKKNGEESDSR